MFYQIKGITCILEVVIFHPNLRSTSRGGGVLPEKLGGGVRPASQNPYPIYDQNLGYSLPYL